jgi:hypothetical protein
VPEEEIQELRALMRTQRLSTAAQAQRLVGQLGYEVQLQPLGQAA